MARQLAAERAALAMAQREVAARCVAVDALLHAQAELACQLEGADPSGAWAGVVDEQASAGAAYWTPPSSAASLAATISSGKPSDERRERAALHAARTWGGDFAAQREGIEELAVLARDPDAARRLVAAGGREIVQRCSSLRPGSAENRRAGAAGAQAAMAREHFLSLTTPHRLAFADVALLAVDMASCGGGGSSGGGGDVSGLLRLLGNSRALHDLEVTRRALLALAQVLRVAGERGHAATLLRQLHAETARSSCTEDAPEEAQQGGSGSAGGGEELVRAGVARAALRWAHTVPDVSVACAEAIGALEVALQFARSPTIRWQPLGSPHHA